MSLSRPRVVVMLDGRSLTGAEAAVARVRVALSVSGAHDRAEVLAWPQSRLAEATPGSTLSVALGEDGEEEDVWAGEVVEVAAGEDGVALDGLSGTVALSRERISRTWVGESVADVVRDLAGSAPVDEVGGDVKLSAYTVDDRRTVWAHLLELAALTGAEVGSAPDGGLRFLAPRTGSADHTFRHGADVLSWRASATSAPTAASVAAYGAASEAGAEQWHWLLRAPSGTAPVRVVPALRTREAADALAQALTARAERAAVRGTLRLRGAPEVRPGALVEVEDLPAGGPGTLRVLSVEHVLDGRAGLVTTLSVEGAGGGGGLGGLL
ncbi:MAG TPA: hypothetical protein VNP72_02030 [Longimicrobium sp.]|nr:hypothetical protein [Longimicrobium sp.]